MNRDELRPMFRTPDIPVAPKRKFDEASYEEEKEWLERKAEGIILRSETDGGVFLAVGTAALIAMVLGGFIGIYITLFTGNWLYTIIPFTIVFLVALFFLKSSFSTVELDPEKKMFLYEGTISLGGEFRSTRYRGPYQVIEGTLLVRFKRFFVFKSKPFVRFMTGSGYLRMNYKPEEEQEFLEKWQELGVLNLEEMRMALLNKPIREGPGYMVYYETQFDRSEFKAEIRAQRAAEKQQEEIDKQIQKQKLVEQSKKFSSQEEDDKIHID